MIDMDFITLEDGLEYGIVDEIIIDNIKYLYLVNDDNRKIELRKLDKNNDLLKITNKKENDEALDKFVIKHKNDLV